MALMSATLGSGFPQTRSCPASNASASLSPSPAFPVHPMITVLGALGDPLATLSCSVCRHACVFFMRLRALQTSPRALPTYPAVFPALGIADAEIAPAGMAVYPLRRQLQLC